jgi:hypothetical protein
VLPCTFGFPQYDISEVVNPAGEEELQAQLDELNETRNLLLAYRLLHYNDKIPNIKLCVYTHTFINECIYTYYMSSYGIYGEHSQEKCPLYNEEHRKYLLRVAPTIEKKAQEYNVKMLHQFHSALEHTFLWMRNRRGR